MTEEDRELLWTIKGAISELPEAERAVCDEVAQEILGLVRDNGEAGILALALVGALLQAVDV